MSEFDDEYSEALETDFSKLQGALLEDTVRLLSPASRFASRGITASLGPSMPWFGIAGPSLWSTTPSG
jgi:hypothetical protein